METETWHFHDVEKKTVSVATVNASKQKNGPISVWGAVQVTSATGTRSFSTALGSFANRGDTVSDAMRMYRGNHMRKHGLEGEVCDFATYEKFRKQYVGVAVAEEK